MLLSFQLYHSSNESKKIFHYIFNFKTNSIPNHTILRVKRETENIYISIQIQIYIRICNDTCVVIYNCTYLLSWLEM